MNHSGFIIICETSSPLLLLVWVARSKLNLKKTLERFFISAVDFWVLRKRDEKQSVVGSGNCTSCKKRGLRKWKTPKNQDLYLYSILKTEKRKSFFNFQSPLWKLEKSAPLSHEKRDIFRICVRYKVKQLSWVKLISHESQKSWKETFLEFFQLFAFFFKVKKSRPFSSFFVWSFWADSCQIKAGIPIFSPLNWQLSKWQVIVDSELWR